MGVNFVLEGVQDERRVISGIREVVSKCQVNLWVNFLHRRRYGQVDGIVTCNWSGWKYSFKIWQRFELKVVLFGSRRL